MIGVLVMAYGGPNNLDEVRNIRNMNRLLNLGLVHFAAHVII